MSKLIQNIALGAVAGAVAHLVVTTVEKRVEDGKPAFPSALAGGLASLIPLAKGIATQVLEVIGQLETNHDDADETADHDTSSTTADAGLTSPPTE